MGWALGLALLLCLLWQRVSTAQTSCTTSAAVEGHSATITCTFASDLSQTKHYLQVLRHEFDKQQHFPGLMASCYWANDSPVPTCTTSDGVRLEGTIGKQATFVIDKVTARHAGEYMCNHALDSHDVKTCNLHVRGNMTSCTDVTVFEEDSTSLTCNFNSDLNKTHDAFSIIWFPKPDGQGETMEYETIVSCNWLGVLDGWLCSGHSLFSFTNDNITDSFRLDITRATLRHSGQFTCSLVLATSNIQTKRCSLAVKRKPTEALTNTSTSFTLTTTQPDGAPSTVEGARSGDVSNRVYFNDPVTYKLYLDGLKPETMILKKKHLVILSYYGIYFLTFSLQSATPSWNICLSALVMSIPINLGFYR